jgi:outer membrane protein assembly factor BamB
VLVADGVAYFAAGIVDCDGTYVYALDAKTGKIKWQNNSCGHLNPELRKGVSAQGNLAIHGDQLLMAGGNQVNPARFDLATGKCLNEPFDQGHPKANHGKFVGLLFESYPIAGGRILYASPENVANKDSFVVDSGRGVHPLNYGGIPPAWSDETIALVNFRDGKLTCCDASKVADRIEKGPTPPERPGPRFWYGLANEFDRDGAVRWVSDLGEPDEFEVVSLAVCPDAVVAVVKFQPRHQAYPQWSVAALRSQDGTELWFWRHNLPSTPLPGGLLVGREGQVVVTMLDGSVLSFGPRQPPAQ